MHRIRARPTGKFDAILLLIDRLSSLHGDPKIWNFYQEIIIKSRNKVESPYVVAMAAAHQDGHKNALIIYNVTRLIYQCIGELLTNSFIVHSNLRIGCSKILIQVGQFKEAAWILRELRYLLSSNEELKKEFSSIANNKGILEELVTGAPTTQLRTLARHILQVADLWDGVR